MNLRDLFLRVRALVAPGRVERDLDEHQERRTKDRAASMKPALRLRQRNHEGRPSRLAGDRDRAAMTLDDGLDDRQAEAAAGQPRCPRRVHFVKPIEYVRKMF